MLETYNLDLAFKYIAPLDLSEIDTNLYLHTTLTVDQFEVFESLCSGSRISRTWDEACLWLKKRQNTLHQEYLSNLEEFGEYGSSYNACKSQIFKINHEFGIAYETSSGTILCSSSSGNYEVFIPDHRLGYDNPYYRKHHLILVLVKAGFSELEIELSKSHVTGLLPVEKKSAFLETAKELELPLDYVDTCCQTQFGDPDSVRNYLAESTREYYTSL